MAHPTGEAAVSTAPISVAEKAADFENYLFDDEAPEEAPEDEQEEAENDEFDDTEEVEEDETDDAEQDDEEDEQAEPAIDAPVSLNAEEKEVFSQLPPEAQRAWAASETRRNTQVQEATTSAKEAQRKAEQAAASAERTADARRAEQMRAFTAAFEPQMPDPSQYQDIQSYQRDKAIYDHSKAQYDQLMQQVEGIGIETDEMKAERIKARDAELMKIPEIANEETRDSFIKGAFEVAAELGYDQSELAEYMDANDLKALGMAAQWKRDSAELAQIKARSKERRRDKSTGQFKSLKPGAAPQPKSRAARSKKSWESVKANKGDRQSFGQAAEAWLTEAGHL